MNNKTIVTLKNIKKKYGENHAVKGVSFDVSEGTIFGLIGPDGAGKTTIMRSLCTLINPDEGSINMFDLDISKHRQEIRNRIGYMPQHFSLYQDLSVEQNMNFFADLFKISNEYRKKRMNELYSFSRLEQFKKRKAGALSGGMKQKLALSCNLIHQPELLILDEPTFGVDPVSRLEFWEMLKKIKKNGTPIIVSTPYMDEADQCDIIALIFNGKIVAMDKPDNVKKLFIYPLYKIIGDVRFLKKYFERLDNINTIQPFGHEIHVSFLEKLSNELLSKFKDECKDKLQSITQIEPGTEDVFLELMEEK